MLYVAKIGILWRDLPERFGKWNSVWRRFDRWCASGVWAKLADALGDTDLEELHLDSTSIRPNPTRRVKKRHDRARYMWALRITHAKSCGCVNFLGANLCG